MRLNSTNLVFVECSISHLPPLAATRSTLAGFELHGERPLRAILASQVCFLCIAGICQSAAFANLGTNQILGVPSKRGAPRREAAQVIEPGSFKMLVLKPCLEFIVG